MFDLETYRRDGFQILPGLLEREEVALLRATARDLLRADREVLHKGDAAGKTTLLKMWNRAGDDPFGLIARDERLVAGARRLLQDDAVYLFSHKMTMKEPREGGAWEWHQDYGYWYKNGCLLPHMASCLIALDPATRENGCLQVLRGSHDMGRVEHGQFGEQTGADPERVAAARERFEHVYCEASPGTGLFFHGNTLHASDANTSPNSRWSLICCYNAARNDPYKDSHHPRYTPLSKVPDTAVKEAGATVSATGKSFLDPEHER